MTVPFEPGRVDATQTRTDVESLEALEPTADGFYTTAATTPRNCWSTAPNS